MTAKRMTRSGVPPFNHYAVLAIYRFEMERARRTLWQSLVTPIITTSLYFIVFGAAIGSRISEVDGVPYGAFIVPGLIMLSLFTESLSNASFGIYLPRFTGTIYGAVGTGVAIGNGARLCRRSRDQIDSPRCSDSRNVDLFVPIQILHPLWMVVFGADGDDFQFVRVRHRRLG